MDLALSILRTVPFLSDISSTDLERIAILLKEKKYSAGVTVFYENSVGDALYIVEEGQLEVVKPIGEEEQVLARIGKGELFGEMGLIENKPRSATVRALSNSVLLVLSKDEFEELLKESPKLYLELARALSVKLRETNIDMIRNLQVKNKELQKAYDDLKAAQEALVNKEKLAAIGMVTSRIIHDIKNPMTSIRGFAEIIAKRFPDSKYFSNIIVKEVEQMVDMTQELLDYARGEERSIQKQLISVPGFIEEILKLYRANFESKGLTIKTLYQYKGDALFDVSKIRRVLSNLITNARDAMRPKGVLTICTWKAGEFIVVEISDTGSGIPEEIREILFEPFVSRGKTHGTGLGLAIAKKVVEEEHRGRIEVESTLGKGTTFRVCIPA